MTTSDGKIVRREENSIEAIRKEHRNSLMELGSAAKDGLLSAIEAIFRVRRLAEIRKIEYEKEDLVKKALGSAARLDRWS